MSPTQNLAPNPPTPLLPSPPQPSGRPSTDGRTLVRPPLQTMLVRDTASFARQWWGKLLVVAVLVALPAAMVVTSLGGGRYGRYADDSWKALLLLVVLAVAYLASRRLVITVLIGAVTVALVSWALSPNLADTRTGDVSLLADIDVQADRGRLDGYHDIAVAEVALDAAQPVRLAGIGADDTTPMEVGSMTKAMTGLVVADAVSRGEIRMDAPVATYLPQLGGSPAGVATMQELVTHTSGYAEFGAATLRRAVWAAPLGRNFLNADTTQMIAEARDQTLGSAGRYAYSSLGSAIAGQAVAAAAHLSYPELMRTRLFEPLGMSRTAIQVDTALVPGGMSQSGLPVQPWVMDAYAPTGGAVSTTGDLARLASRPPRRNRPRNCRLWSRRPPPTSRTPGSAPSGIPPPGRPVRPSPTTPGRPAATPPGSDSTARHAGPSSSCPTSPTTPVTSAASCSPTGRRKRHEQHHHSVSPGTRTG